MASRNLTNPLRESLFRVTSLRSILPASLIARHEDIQQELLQFELDFVFSHLLGIDIPNYPSQLDHHTQLHLDQLTQECNQRAELLGTHQRLLYVVGNVWRWRGDRIFEASLSTSITREDWDTRWHVYRSITEAALTDDAPKHTWNELLSQGVRFKRPMGLVVGEDGDKDRLQAAATFNLKGSDLGTPDFEDDSPDVLDSNAAISALSSIASDGPIIERLRSMSLKTPGDLGAAFDSCLKQLKKKKKDKHWVLCCEQLYSELDTALSLDAVAFLFRSLYRYYLQPTGASSFFSFPYSTFIESDQRVLTAILSVGSSSSFTNQYIWMLELIANKLLAPYLHCELVKSLTRTSALHKRVANLANIDNIAKVDHIATLASAEIQKRTSNLFPIGMAHYSLQLPVEHLKSLSAQYRQDGGRDNYLLGRLVVGGLFQLHNIRGLNLSIACGMIQKAPQMGVLLLNILKCVENDRYALYDRRFLPALNAAVSLERLLDPKTDALNSCRNAIQQIVDTLKSGSMPTVDLIEHLKTNVTERDHHVPDERFRTYCKNKLHFDDPHAPTLSDDELELIRTYCATEYRNES